jgi:hypothetical protein
MLRVCIGWLVWVGLVFLTLRVCIGVVLRASELNVRLVFPLSGLGQEDLVAVRIGWARLCEVGLLVLRCGCVVSCSRWFALFALFALFESLGCGMVIL